VLIAPGTYVLTHTLAISGPLEDVAIRGASGRRDDVVLVGPGRDVESSAVPHGIWVSGDVRRLLVANLTIRDVRYHPICFNPGPRAPRVYNVHLVNGGQQLIKANPATDGSGVDDGAVEYSLLEYDPTARDAYANAIDVHGGARWLIRDNLVRNVRPPSAALAGPAVLMWNHTADAVVEANTFVNCQRAISLGLIARPGHDNTGVVIANNLCNRAIAGRDGATASVNGNDTSASPDLFVNPRGGDLRLLPSAARAIDSAAPDPGVATDWDGRPRAAGVASDIGAWEWQPGSTVPAPLDFTQGKPPR
jgi:hypothetical protein